VFNIFISYSQEDFRAGSRYIKNYISRHLQDSDVFLDQSKNDTKLRDEIERILAVSDIFIVVLTHGALESSEITKDIDLARRDKERFIIPCKDKFLEINSSNISRDLAEYDWISFSNIEELARKLVTEIKKIKKQIEQGNTNSIDHVEMDIISGNISLPYHVNQEYSLEYKIKNGEVLSAIPERDTASIKVSLASFNSGEIKLNLPKNIIDAKTKDEDIPFFILIDGIESNHMETSENLTRILTIPFEKGSSEITIIGTQIFGM
jgi:hypothetical protein